LFASYTFSDTVHVCTNWLRLKQENEILSNQIVEKLRSVEREKSEFIESHLAERRNEIEKLKEHHRLIEIFQFLLTFNPLMPTVVICIQL